MLLLQLLVVLVVTRLCGAALARAGQPRAVGEIVAGLALGPSLFGAVAPAAQRALFPPDGLGPLRTLADLGVLAGTLVPRDGGHADAVVGQLGGVIGTLFLPIFFASTGLRTVVHLAGDPASAAAFGALLAVAVAGKIGGSAAGARPAGESWRDALALGALMNTRGLMALVVVTVGLDAGVIAPPLFSLMVLVALVTTAMTTPLLSLLGVTGAPAPAPARAFSPGLHGRRQPGP